jgi:nucleoside-diphosphate-sugar epimerase
VYISSDAVYADSTAGPITEQTPCDPGDLYGLMHFTRERMLMDAAQRSEVVMARVRTTGVYGAGDTHNGYGPNRFMRSIRAERRVSLIGDGEERRDHIYIDDLVKLLVLILRFRSAGLINAASGRSVCFAEVAGLMRELAGADVAIEHLPRERAVTHRHFDISAMRAAFPGFEPRLLEDALRPHSASA